jgi:hypothetical protein
VQSQTVPVYVRLLNEGTDVSRPAPALLQKDGSYLLFATDGYDPQDEKWEFFPGTRVICEKKIDQLGNEYLQAVSAKKVLTET